MAASVDLVVVGSANVDRVVRVDRHPAPGETVLGGDTALFPGGKGANTAVAAARQGVRTGFVGAVGEDDGGALLLAALADAGVETSTVRRVEDISSGAAHITVTPDGENAIVVSPGANARVSAADVRAAEDVINAASVLFTVLEVPLETVEFAVAHAAARGVRVVLNASPVTSLPAETLAVLDPLIVNKHEAAVLLGLAGDRGSEPSGSDASSAGSVARLSSAELAAGLRARGPRSVVVTLGAEGAVLADADGVVALPAPELGDGRVVDTTGAGDAFAGALAATLATGVSLRDAVRHAVSYAAESVTQHGAQGT